MRVFEDAVAAIPGARVVVVPGGTHAVHTNEPRIVNERILAFLEENGSRLA